MNQFTRELSRSKSSFSLLLTSALLLGMTVLSACDRKQTADVAAPDGSPPTSAPPANAIEIKLVYGSEKKDWIAEATSAFNRQAVKIADGRTVWVTALPMGSGECIDEVLNGTTQAHLVSPASGAFITLGNAKYRAVSGNDLVGPTENLLLSPVVIAMWKPMAEALGWPNKPVGWKDVLDLAKTSDGWASRGHPEWGKFKFGHTHPEFSNSGLISVLAETYAGAGKKRDLDLDDLRRPEVGACLGDIERSVVHYGTSTGFFADKMFENGTAYLSAAVLYESSVIDSTNRPTPTEFPVVAIYPQEGTFWSDHPIGVVKRDWVTDAHKEAAKLYTDYLRAEPQQRLALKYGFRPGNTAVALGAPIDAAHGVDPKQPTTTLDVPDAGTVDAAIALWRANKKHANIVLVFDTSGSMQEQGKIVAAREGATDLIRSLDDDDTLSLLPFSTQPNWSGKKLLMRTSRQRALQTVGNLTADGETALYTATAMAEQYLLANPQPDKIFAVVVLTDGIDSGQGIDLDSLLGQIRPTAEQNSVRIFTIAYGSDAKPDILNKIANTSRAKSYKGDPKTIKAVFKEISTFF